MFDKAVVWEPRDFGLVRNPEMLIALSALTLTPEKNSVGGAVI